MSEYGPTDLALITSWQLQGDQSAFDMLYRRHTPRMVAVATLRVGPSDGEDVVQEAWLRALRRQDELAGYAERWRGHIRPWLGRVATNVSNDMLRRRRILSFISVDPAVLDSPEQDFPEVAAIQEAAESETDRADNRLTAVAELQRVLGVPLKKRDREFLEEVVIQEADYAEYGRTHQMSPNAVKLKVASLRRKLRSQLQAKAAAPESEAA